MTQTTSIKLYLLYVMIFRCSIGRRVIFSICIYFASVLLHLVTMDLSRFVQVEYSLINNEHKLDILD